MANRSREPDYYVMAMAFFRCRREELNLYQKEVAVRVGVTLSTYWRWESGKPNQTSLSDGDLEKLLDILKATQEQLDEYIVAKKLSNVLIVQTGESIVHPPNQPDEQSSGTPTVSAPADLSDASISNASAVSTLETLKVEQESERTVISHEGSFDGKPSITHGSSKRLWTGGLLVIVLSLATGFILGSVNTPGLQPPSRPHTQAKVDPTATAVAIGQGATRPSLFQEFGEANRDMLGEPTEAVVKMAVSPLGESGESQEFVKGTIYLADHSNKAYAVIGNMARTFHQTGGVAGPHALGFPTSDVGSAAASRIRGVITPGTFQRFERGSLYESAYGAYPVVGAMNQEHERLRGTDGRMGFPKGMPHYRDGKIIQDFEGGRFTVDDTN